MKIYWPEIFNYLFLISVMLEIGMLVNWQELLQLLKDRGFLLRVLAVNLVLIPLLGLFIVWLFKFQGEYAVGILLLASAPGGLASMRFARKIPGKLAFAAATEFTLTLAALFLTPLLASLVFPREFQLRLQSLELALWFLLLIGLPLLAGFAIHKFLPAFSKKLAKPLLLLSSLCFLLVTATAAGIKKTAFKEMGWEMLGALALLILASLLLGWLFGGKDPWHRRILAVATCIRNVGMCLLVAHRTYPDTNVDMVIIAYMGLMIPISMIFVSIQHFLEKRDTKKPA